MQLKKKQEAQLADKEAEVQMKIEEAEAASNQELQELSKSHKQQLKDHESEYSSKKSDHEKQVKTTFENINTLKYVKELRFFKKQWQEQKTEDKRKKIASEMAKATKQWVGDGEMVE